MRSILMTTFAAAISACAQIGSGETPTIIGMDSFSLAARYGTPASYQILEDYMQLTYGSDATGCRLIVLIDHDQRVAGWATADKACSVR